jgi:hypothetical protein
LNAKAVPADSPVPDAVGRVLTEIRNRLGADRIDRVWIFPPLIRGRREWGLVAVSGLTPRTDRRTLFTARYLAELTGRGVTVEIDVGEEGDAPPDRLPRVMDGVARRSDLQLGEPREVEVLGDAERFIALLMEYGGAGDSVFPKEGR